MKQLNLLFFFVFISQLFSSTGFAQEKPNIVYIMSDELAYFEVGYMGNDLLKTPRIDALAKESLVFTNALAGAPVCAPLRASLMTGKHMGHCSVRANDGGSPLRAEEPTIASMLKELGYATGGFGKWGAGGRGSTGIPEKHGFDVFFGYYDQVHAHSFYPPYLIRNSKEVVLPGNQGGRSGKTYSHYEIMNEGLDFIRKNKDQPFFCYLPITPPHGMYDIPDSDPAWKEFKDKDWSEDAKRYAAMVKMVDRNVGEVLDLLKELNLDDNTILFFAGDNGGQDRFRTKDRPRGFFGPNVNPTNQKEFRGGKGNLYEGGLRIPSMVHWPNKIKPATSELIFYHPDIYPTLGKLVGGKIPDDLDGISILPTILGEEAAGEKQVQREMLYWEFGKQTAVRFGNWKAIQPRKNANWELYDLSKDISETKNVAKESPKTLERMVEFAKKSHTPVKPGTYGSRDNHLKDRKAKWGTAKQPTPKIRGAVKWKAKGLIDSKNMKVAKVSSEHIGGGRLAKCAIDGDSSTLWHTEWTADTKKTPHELVIDLGGNYEITGVRYLARQGAGYNGAIANCEISVLKDISDERTSATTKITFKKTKQIQNAKLNAGTGRYVRITPKSEVNGGKWASIAEIGFVGTEKKE